MAKKNLDVIGKWAFLIGLVIAIVAGLYSFSYAALIIFILGLIVGFLNITGKDTTKFLIAAIALLIIGVASISALSEVIGTASTYLEGILENFISFVSAATLIVAIKAIYESGKK